MINQKKHKMSKFDMLLLISGILITAITILTVITTREISMAHPILIAIGAITMGLGVFLIKTGED